MNQAAKTSLLWLLGFWLFTWSLGVEFFRAIQVGLCWDGFFYDASYYRVFLQLIALRKCGENYETYRRETRGFRKHSYICNERCALPVNSASSLVLSFDRC